MMLLGIYITSFNLSYDIELRKNTKQDVSILINSINFEAVYFGMSSLWLKDHLN